MIAASRASSCKRGERASPRPHTHKVERIRRELPRFGAWDRPVCPRAEPVLVHHLRLEDDAEWFDYLEAVAVFIGGSGAIGEVCRKLYATPGAAPGAGHVRGAAAAEATPTVSTPTSPGSLWW